MAEIWQTRDYRGRAVTFTEASHGHILAQHDELADRLDEVREAVEAPDFVTRDRRYSHRELHYRRTPSGKAWIKVVINYRPVAPQGTWVGVIITAYRVEHRGRREEPITP